METEQPVTADVNSQLLAHAARQTKALENINWVLMAMFVLFLIGGGIYLIALASS